MSTDNAILRQIVFALTGTFEGVSSNMLLQRILTAFSSGVFQFRQSAKPTTRPDGSALVSGDRWYSTDDNLWFFWNGTYWLSEVLFRATAPSSNVGLLPVDKNGLDIYIERFEVAGQTGATNSGSQYAVYTLERRPETTGSDVSIGAVDTRNYVNTLSRFYESLTVNTHYDVSALGLTSFRVVQSTVGGGSAATGISQGIRYRFAKP